MADPVFQDEAAALSDAEHGLGRAVPAGHPTGHLCLRVSEGPVGPGLLLSQGRVQPSGRD